MYCVRGLLRKDLHRVHEFTIKLLQHHHNQGVNSRLSVFDFVDLFDHGLFNGLVLVNKIEKKVNALIGCILYYPIVSLTYGSKGLLIEQFYIEPEFRNKGLGKLLLIALCSKAIDKGCDHVKLMYQDGLGLHEIYTKMGFINTTHQGAKLHLFEAYGKSQLARCKNYFKNWLIKAQKSRKIDETRLFRQLEGRQAIELDNCIIITIPLGLDPSMFKPTLSIDSRDPYSTHNSLTPGQMKPPLAQLVLIVEKVGSNIVETLALATESSKTTSLNESEKPELAFASAILNSSDSAVTEWVSTGCRLCAFIEQPSMCFWLGRMMCFTGFLGDINLLTPGILSYRLNLWMHHYPLLQGAIWEVPTMSNVAPLEFKNDTRVSSLDSCNASCIQECLFVEDKDEKKTEVNDKTDKPVDQNSHIIDNDDSESWYKRPNLLESQEKQKNLSKLCKMARELLEMNEGVSDDTILDGWNIAYLNREGIAQLVKRYQTLLSDKFSYCICICAWCSANEENDCSGCTNSQVWLRRQKKICCSLCTLASAEHNTRHLGVLTRHSLG